MAYRIEIMPEAKHEIEHEPSYSHRQWGAPHASEYRRNIIAYLRKIAANPLQYSIKPLYGDDVRVARYKGNYIVYLCDTKQKIIQIIGFPNVHKNSVP